VLRIAAARHSVLLTGDIERRAELALLADPSVRSDILVVPHHGSRTSSSSEFVAAVSPRWAVVPVGYRSRFGHPHPEVLARYGAAGARVVRTDLDGAIEVRLRSDGAEVGRERRSRGRYWLQ
jgi:competence protein ComEC